MSQAPTNPAPPRPTVVAGATVDQHLSCPGCGYDLIGLKVADRCPECGAPIRTKVRFTSGMTEAPTPYLARLARGATALGVGGGLMLLWGLVLVHVPAMARWIPTAGVLLAATGLWAWGAWRVLEDRRTAPGEKADPAKEWLGVRRVARWGALLWPLVGMLVFLGATVATSAVALAPVVSTPILATPTPPPSGMSGTLFLAAAAAWLLAMLSVIPLALHMAYLADWAQDYQLAMRLRGAPFMLIVSIPVLAIYRGIIPFLMGKWIPIFSWPAAAVLLGLISLCLWFVVIPVGQFVALCHWARVNARSAIERDRRASSKIVKRIMDAQAKPEKGPQRTGHRPATPQGNYLPPGEGGTYELGDPKT